MSAERILRESIFFELQIFYSHQTSLPKIFTDELLQERRENILPHIFDNSHAAPIFRPLWGGALTDPWACAESSCKNRPRPPHRGRNSAFRVSKELTFGLFLDSFETPGRTLSALLGPCPGVLFPDSFRTLPGFQA